MVERPSLCAPETFRCHFTVQIPSTQNDSYNLIVEPGNLAAGTLQYSRHEQRC